MIKTIKKWYKEFPAMFIFCTGIILGLITIAVLKGLGVAGV